MGGFSCGPFLLRNFGLAWRTTGRAANGGRLIFFFFFFFFFSPPPPQKKITTIDSGHRDPKAAFQAISSWLMPQPARARVCRGGSRNAQQSQAERQPRGRGHALESSFWSVALRTAQGGRSRNAKRPGALTGIDLAESADCPSMSSGKGSDAHGHGSALGAFATLSAAVVVAYLLPAGEDKRRDTRGSRDLRRAATVRVPPLARRLSGAAVGSRALPLKYRRAAGKTSCSASTATFRIIASLRLLQA